MVILMLLTDGSSKGEFREREGDGHMNDGPHLRYVPSTGDRRKSPVSSDDSGSKKFGKSDLVQLLFTVKL